MIYIGQNAVVHVGNATIDVSKVSFSEFTEANEKPAVSVTAALETSCECTLTLDPGSASKFWQMMRDATGTDIVCPWCGLGRRYKNHRAALRAWARLRTHVCPRGSR